jgi:hypothetical protein
MKEANCRQRANPKHQHFNKRCPMHSLPPVEVGVQMSHVSTCGLVLLACLTQPASCLLVVVFSHFKFLSAWPVKKKSQHFFPQKRLQKKIVWTIRKKRSRRKYLIEHLLLFCRWCCCKVVIPSPRPSSCQVVKRNSDANQYAYVCQALYSMTPKRAASYCTLLHDSDR